MRSNLFSDCRALLNHSLGPNSEAAARWLAPLAALGVLFCLPPPLPAQTVPNVVGIEAEKATLKHGSEAQVPLRLIVKNGYHINSNTPAEDYLIPTVLSWTPAGEAAKYKLLGVTYPKAESVKYDFSEKPLLVYSGAVTVVSRFAIPADAPHGEATLSGKLRYQACTNKACLAPRTLEVSIPVAVE